MTVQDLYNRRDQFQGPAHGPVQAYLAHLDEALACAEAWSPAGRATFWQLFGDWEVVLPAEAQLEPQGEL